jgi:hypothetical protein
MLLPIQLLQHPPPLKRLSDSPETPEVSGNPELRLDVDFFVS